MTTNIDRAAEEIRRVDGNHTLGAGALAEALADAGLLMPGLPEPEMKDGRTVWRVDEEGFVYIKPHGWIATVAVGNPYDSPSIAYRHALALIAAANHAEQEQDNA